MGYKRAAPATNKPVAQVPGGQPRRGGRLLFAFVGGSTESRNVLQVAATAIDYVGGRVVYDPIGEFVNDAPQWRVAEPVTPNAGGT